MWWELFDRLTRTESVCVGNHRLILNGRLTIGPKFLYAISILIVVVSCQSIVLKLMLESSVLLALIFLALAKTEILLLLSVALTDPGIVPPKKSATSGRDQLTSIVNGTKVDQKWCHMCNVFMPPRGKHCGVCGCCVDKHDHHCKFLSNCIGVRNYRSFVLLLTNSVLTSAFTLLVMMLRSSPMEAILFWSIVGVSALTFVLCCNLVAYHGRLILRGSTSYEEYRGFVIDDDQDEFSPPSSNPFSLGSWRANLNAFLTTPTEPSRVRSWITTGKRTGDRSKIGSSEDEMTAVLDASPLA